MAALLLADEDARCIFAARRGACQPREPRPPADRFFPMPIFHPDRTLRILLAAAVLSGATGCRRTEAEYQKLVQENAHLRSEIERLSRKTVEEKAEEKAGLVLGEPDLASTIVDIWSQRFDDNEFRSRQRLSDKIIRVTGAVDGVAADSISLAGASKRFGNVRMGVHLASGYALRIRDGLSALERGSTVTVQGRFNYERMILSEAMFVEQVSGRALYSDDLLALSSGITLSGAPRARPAPATPAPAPQTAQAPK